MLLVQIYSLGPEFEDKANLEYEVHKCESDLSISVSTCI